jgi:hypothetical protein
MQQRRQINADPGAQRLRSSMAAATEPVRAAAWTVEERLLWRGVDWVRGHSEALKWPFERVAWIVERWVIWPIQERTAISGQILGAGALAFLGIALVVFSVATLSGGDGPTPARVATTAPPAAATSAPAPGPGAPSEPVLKGAPPSFGLGDGVGIAEPADPDAGTIAAGTNTAATGFETETGATTSSQEPVSAGPAAMKVARRFAEAFVFYEIGEKPARTQEIFEETTSGRLAAALEQRPPRQPAGVEVPQARVLNLVPGPRSGRTYSVSASLLRLGTTSELRLQIEKKNGTWVVTDVRG